VTVAVLCDIHGNLAALDAVLAEVPADATIVVGGDIAAGGQQPRETVERLQALGDRVRWVRGNVDRALRPGEDAFALPEAVEFTRAQLTAEQVALLVDLPTYVQLGRTIYCHASPRNDMDIFTERTPAEQIAFLFADLDADTVVCGHTHLQFDRTIGGTRVVNAGSVGSSADAEPGACWLLDLDPRRTPFQGAVAPDHTREAWLDWLETMTVRREDG
jgi:putative phosphoesterase